VTKQQQQYAYRIRPSVNNIRLNTAGQATDV
jgi:hypothetical protein